MEPSGLAAVYPTAEHIRLLHILSAIVSSIHFLYLAIVVGGATFSLVFLLLDWRDPNPELVDAARLALPPRWLSPAAILLLGVVPLLSLMLMLDEVTGRASFKALEYGAFTLVVCAIGFVVLALYRRHLDRAHAATPGLLATGALGVSLPILGYFQLVQIEVLAAYPEKWPFLTHALPFFPVGTILPRFLLFTSVALAVSCALLMLSVRAASGEPGRAPAVFTAVVTYAGLVLALASAPVSVWTLYTMPSYALSSNVFAAELVLVALLVTVAYLLLKAGAYRSQSVRPGLLLSLVVVLVLSYAVQSEMVRAQANRELERGLAVRAEKVREAIEAEREERLAELQKVDGSQIFQRVCSACHRFDRRLVGPPLASVVPKYAEKPGELVAFILNPVKRNPDYPPMPNPGLKKFEAKAVAEFLLQKLAGAPAGGQSP